MLAMSKIQVGAHWVACADCGDWYDPTDVPGCKVQRGLDEITVCANCAERLGCKRCDDCNEWFEERDLRDCGGDYYCEECQGNNSWYECYCCNELIHSDDLREGADNNNYCDSCWNDYFDACEHCGEVCYSNDMIVRHEQLVCRDCAERYYPDGDFKPAGFRGRDSYTRMTSRRKFGVELETSYCDGYMDLDGDAAWGAKDDCSITGKEFVSDILYGDAGLDAVERLCDFADSNGWEVNSDCGYHAHFDMRDESADSMKAIALAYILTYEVWGDYVDERRIGNRFCKPNRADSTTIYGITSWRRFADYSDRFEWINFAAYYKHQTFEVRMHEGTLDGQAVCNWVRAHAAFMDWASAAGWAKVRNILLCKDNAAKADFIAKVWRDAGCDDLPAYYKNKACVA